MDKRKSFVFPRQYRNFNRIQDGVGLKSSCVQKLKFQNVPYFRFFHAVFSYDLKQVSNLTLSGKLVISAAASQK